MSDAFIHQGSGDEMGRDGQRGRERMHSDKKVQKGNHKRGIDRNIGMRKEE